MNLALLSKLSQKMAKGHHCLWIKIIQALYLSGDSFFYYKLKKRASWLGWQIVLINVPENFCVGQFLFCINLTKQEDQNKGFLFG